MAGTIEEKVAELVTPLVESMDLTVWGIRFRGGNDHAMLQVFVDSEQGVSADKCGELMDVLSPALDAADLIAPKYTLEVSSPGLDRPLKKEAEFIRHAGDKVEIHTFAPFEGRKLIVGTLVGLSADSQIQIVVDGNHIQIPRDKVSQIRLYLEF